VGRGGDVPAIRVHSAAAGAAVGVVPHLVLHRAGRVGAQAGGTQVVGVEVGEFTVLAHRHALPAQVVVLRGRRVRRGGGGLGGPGSS
jgi:hypothetical protein